uniref:Uncharacterized protein n=1 Tax=Spongospora subterranea TaxID=70186 RepID=A0A0H5QX89_9EUKA|eukprot:CRZ06608.1 hypothetical protein [Spongospora subterranea]
MSFIIGVSSIILSIALQIIFIEAEKNNEFGLIYVLDDELDLELIDSTCMVLKEIKLERMEIPEKELPVMEWINVLSSENGFGVFKVLEHLKHKFLGNHCNIRDDDNMLGSPLQLVEPLQTVISDGVHGAHPDWIVMTLAVELQKHKGDHMTFAQIDLPHDADLNYLLKDFRKSLSIMSSLAQNDSLRTTALRVYDGDMEQLVKDRLTLIHLMKVWAPLEPVGFSPLAFTPHPKKDNVHTCHTHSSTATFHILTDNSHDEKPQKWYTRYDMPVGEMYVWNATSVAFAAVCIDEDDEEDNVTYNPIVSIDTLVMIVKPNVDLNTLTSSGDETSELCYTKSFYRQVLDSNGGDEEVTEEVLKSIGYPRSCSQSKRPRQTQSDQAVKESQS